MLTAPAAPQHDPLTGAAVLVTPDRGRYTAITARPATLARPSGSDPCPFCPGHEDATEQLLEQLPASGPWQARAVPNRYPVLRTDGPGLRGSHEVLVLHPDHDTDLATMTDADATTAVQLVHRRLAAAQAEGWASVTGWANVGALSGSSQPHLHAQVLAASTTPPALAAELAAARCALCADRPAERVVTSTGRVAAWVPAMPQFGYEVRIAPLTHDSTVDNLAAPGPAAEVVTVLTAALRAVHTVLGRVSYNVVWHVPPAGTDLHPHLHLLPRVYAVGGLELACGWTSSHVDPTRWAAQLRAALPAGR